MYVSQGASIVVQQSTLDIEHYLGEALSSNADWGHQYLSLTDYDLQIVEVSSCIHHY